MGALKQISAPIIYLRGRAKMQAGFDQMGKLYIKFAMNFALPLAKGSQDIIVINKYDLKKVVDAFINTKVSFGIGGTNVGKIIDYESPTFGHYIFNVIIDDQHKELMLKLISANHPNTAANFIDKKGELNTNLKDASMATKQSHIDPLRDAKID